MKVATCEKVMKEIQEPPFHILLEPIIKIFSPEANGYKSFYTQIVPRLGTCCVLNMYLRNHCLKFRIPFPINQAPKSN